MSILTKLIVIIDPYENDLPINKNIYFWSISTLVIVQF